MSNAIYPKFKEALEQATAGSSLAGSGTTGVYAALIDTGVYTYGASDEFYSAISSAVIGTPQEILSKTFAGGLFDGADVAIPSVSGASVEAVVLYVRNAGANTTWRLVAYIDTGVTGLPITPNGGDIDVTWNASGILQL